MKIIALEAENVKRLKAVAIRPDSNLVEITGKNGQGKTSVLDAIWWAIEGAGHIQAEPIRHGASSAVIRLRLGGGDQTLLVTRKFSSKEEGGFSTSMTVEDEHGARLPSPQAVLDALVGELSFDPLAFTRMKPKEQFDALKVLVPGVDFAEIDRANKADFDKRTDVNRAAKAKRANADAILLPPGKVPELVDVSELEGKLADASRHNTELAQRRHRRERAVEEVKELADEIKVLEAKLAEMRERQATLQNALDTAEALPEPINVDEVTAALSAAREGNKVAELAKQKATLEEEARKLEEESERLTLTMEERTRQKQEAIEAAKMPVAGLGFGDDAILLNGVPFDQASDAEQLRASVAIAAAMNPRLRVIRVRDGSLLDDEAMGYLAEFADEQDMQVWIERVDSSGMVGFVLENGYLKGEAPAEPEREEAEAI